MNFNLEHFWCSKGYDSTEVDYITWLHVPSETRWSNSSDTHQIVEIRKEIFTKMYILFSIGFTLQYGPYAHYGHWTIIDHWPNKECLKYRKYKKRLLLRCICHFKLDLINNMDHMRISDTEPSSVILGQTKKMFKIFSSNAPKVPLKLTLIIKEALNELRLISRNVVLILV